MPGSCKGVAHSKGCPELAHAYLLVFKKMETVFETEFTTAKSGLPSPLKSLTTIEVGCVPVTKLD